jgi:hypothetical protein
VTAENPGFGELIVPQTGVLEDLPHSPVPYFAQFGNGLFLHREMLIGRGAVRQTKWPTGIVLPKFENDKGSFVFGAQPVPANLMGQVVNFFERVYDRQHTEAAILLVMHAETKEWRIFVPTQLVSHGGVNYVYEPSDIQYPWTVVGSIHSHCNFGAGHSSTDTGDADGFDGLHMTIGHIKDAVPQIVAMVAMNKVLFHYDKDIFPKLFDYSECKEHQAPEWWDRYVENPLTKTKPIGFELYAKYDRPTVVKSETKLTPITKPSPGYQPSQYRSEDWSFNQQVGRMVHKDWVINKDNTITYAYDRKPEQNEKPQLQAINGTKPGDMPKGMTQSEFEQLYDLFSIEDEMPNATLDQLLDLGYRWDETLEAWTWRSAPERVPKPSRDYNRLQRIRDAHANVLRPATPEEMQSLGLAEEDLHWEELLPGLFVDRLMDANLVTDADLDVCFDKPRLAGTEDHWRRVLAQKAVAAVELLQSLGVGAYMTFDKPVPEYASEDDTGEETIIPLDGAKPPQQQQPGVN